MTMTATASLEDLLAQERESVETLDRSYESALRRDADVAGARAAYEAAKRSYRRAEQAAFADGLHWTCGRCGGTGVWPGNGGVCFNCGGCGLHPNQVPHKFEANPRVRLKREAKANAARAAEQSALDAALDALPGTVAAALRAAEDRYQSLNGYYSDTDEMTGDERFNHSLYGKLRKYGSLSAAQVAAVERGLVRRAERDAEAEALKSAPPLAAGKRDVEGVVLTTKTQRSERYGSTLKMLVKQDDGNKVWGTVPRALTMGTWDETGEWVLPAHETLVGCRVAFTATVERSDDDEHFGFFARPTKARLA